MGNSNAQKKKMEREISNQVRNGFMQKNRRTGEFDVHYYYFAYQKLKEYEVYLIIRQINKIEKEVGPQVAIKISFCMRFVKKMAATSVKNHAVNYPSLSRKAISKSTLVGIKLELQGARIFDRHWYDFFELGEDNISSRGCKQIIKAGWNSLQVLRLHTSLSNLDKNNIGEKGSFYLSKARWPNLKTLFLGLCQIRDRGCRGIPGAYWIKINNLELDLNNIKQKGSEFISKIRVDSLKQLNIQKNPLGSLGQSYKKQLCAQVQLPHKRDKKEQFN